jgi:hypothetical protein
VGRLSRLEVGDYTHEQVTCFVCGTTVPMRCVGICEPPFAAQLVDDDQDEEDE